ncbi:DUF4271 domain-containing protein [Planobacterium oryzisoli]|uniref:DUF4271 domain-containing protein n=1 Tax=Planobacterium oryzisoli TaxID=2771435 RepID=A0A931E8F1_9FLAO|nr:DUF4271 domain-containing protein [Planobacterium oryzisoli]MBF5026902.1 DUF4271 domain-containing protein [Planobacterium oryzisoli]
MLRIVENTDWVVGIILGSVLLYILVLHVLQRQPNVLKFLNQDFQDSGNIFPSFLLVSTVFIVLLSTLTYNFVPSVPRWVSQVGVAGFEPTRFGYTLLVVSVFYFVKFFLTFFFFSSVDILKGWGKMYFLCLKYYFVLGLVLIVLLFFVFFTSVDHFLLLQLFFYGAGLSLFFKVIYFLLHPGRILPQEWYYKILYICTLQFVPYIVLGKLLFI